MTTREQERDLINIRRSKIQEILAKGYTNHGEIARLINISRPTVTKDIDFLRQEAQRNLKEHIESRIPHQYSLCETGLHLVLRNAYGILASPSIRTSEKLQSLSLISDIYGKLMTLSTDEKTISQAISWIENKKKELQHELVRQKEEQEPSPVAEEEPIQEVGEEDVS